ncbi:hypothetical protein P4H27_00225 [Paenibacillus taichungensis]|uniref:hypothetical protein n=1 Tax=Paenibacillus taichungensis TaxID=484184 RepID=UPI002DBED834|nr:hypothetical protein [Paenibacillus taichungensis]MEC0105357.1 hypothetical protein [Paenibacillus taichungensis]MEC0200432.1 hypothetical protein [Paenibacillus taichungensis]
MESVLMGDKDWMKEDYEFSPKRRVDNKISWQRPHIIGSFHSRKMKRTIEYHSLNECLFYYFLEVDVSTLRYYVQPLEVPIPFINKKGEKKYWLHVPDVLVFRNGYQPLLYQIKEAPDDVGKTFQTCNEYCRKLVNLKSWKYDVIYPKTLPKTVLSNLQILQGYLRERNQYSLIRKDVMFNLMLNGPISIEKLSYCFPSHSPADVKPFLFHLIATGEVEINITIPLSQHTEIELKGRTMDYSINTLYQSAFGIEQ